MFERAHKQTLTQRLENEPRRFIQIIYGPRQVGKTTIVNQFSAQTQLPVHYISADAMYLSQATWIEQQWEMARIMLLRSDKQEGVLIFDEIQKIDNWSETVKKEWDADTRNGINLKVVLLGSSRLLIQQGLSESLAGRFESIFAGHWTYSEMYNAFGLTEDQYVWFGGYPGGAMLADQEDRWKQYIHESLIETSISKDILMLTRVDKPALMKRLFELGCAFSGQILSYNKIMGQLSDAGNTTTLAHYLNLLDTAGLLKGIEKYSPGILRQRSSSPKFQVHNTALLSAKQHEQFKDIRNKPDLWGRWVESAIGTHLLGHSLTSGYELYYWRQGNDEVDFIISYKEKSIAIEVKSGASGKSAGLSRFSKIHHPHKLMLVGATGIPWQEFLRIDPLELFNE